MTCKYYVLVARWWWWEKVWSYWLW